MSRAPGIPAFVAFLLLALAVLATQLGGLGREVIDPDESSFILMGADVAMGHLPFVHQFDLKPPVIFLLIGGVFALLGDSLAAVRLLGDAMVLGTALLLFLTARRHTGSWAALGGALLWVAMASTEFGQPTYSELPAALFTVGALWLLTKPPVSRRAAMIAGLCTALAVLSRTNLYPLPVIIGLMLLFANRIRPGGATPYAWLAFGLGGLIPVGLLVLTYAVAGQLAILRLAMIDVPLAYADQMGPLAVMQSHASQLYVWITMKPLILIPAVLLGGAGLVMGWRRKALQAGTGFCWFMTISLVFTVALAVSLMVSGAAYPHYWLQIMPLLALSGAVALGQIAPILREVSPRLAPMAALLVLAPLGAAMAERLPESATVAADPASADDRFEIAAAARHIALTGSKPVQVWAWRKHLIHWYLHAPQLSPASVHPDNLARPPIMQPLARAGYVSDDEIGRLMTMVPEFVVTDSKDVGIGWLRAAERPIDSWLAVHYRLDARFGDVVVYRRVN